MKAVSEEFKQVVKGSHRIAVEARVHAPDGSVTDLDLIDGSVTLSASALIRGSCQLTVNGSEWVPRGIGDRLAPYGAEVEIRRGVYLSNGATETVPLGWFGIERLEISDDGLETRVEGMDRGRRLQYALIEEPQTLEAGVPLMETVLRLAWAVWPDVPCQDGIENVSSLSIGIPGFLNPGDDRWEAMVSIAAAAGLILFFDGDGLLTARPFSGSDPVAEVSEGEGGVLLQSSRVWDRADAFNRVIATAESSGSDDPVRAVATDDDPMSPTYYYGVFGMCPTFYELPLLVQIDDLEAATQTAANSKLRQELGAAQSVSFGMVPNPALEPDDTIRITRDRLGVDEHHFIQDLTIGLGPDAAMTGTTRTRLDLAA